MTKRKIRIIKDTRLLETVTSEMYWKNRIYYEVGSPTYEFIAEEGGDVT